MNAGVFELKGGALTTSFCCQQENGETDDATTQTLMDFIQQTDDLLPQVEALMKRHQAGEYQPEPKYENSCDWGVNQTLLWLRPPTAKLGQLAITNEWTIYNGEDGDYGPPNQQHFTYEQFWAAMKHWQAFREIVAQKGKENLVGQRFEAPWPEA